jgi:hypothetical protein
MSHTTSITKDVERSNPPGVHLHCGVPITALVNANEIIHVGLVWLEMHILVEERSASEQRCQVDLLQWLERETQQLGSKHTEKRASMIPLTTSHHHNPVSKRALR